MNTCLLKKENFFQELALQFRNSLSGELCQMSKSNFKNNLHDILLQRLLKHDDYIDVSKILVNFDSSV